MNTKDKIMEVALQMFSERGYEAVSIRDICGVVGIKESTLYYHFKNKQDILDSLISKFENHINELLSHIDDYKSIAMLNEEKENREVERMDSYMMDSYLFDPFCNLMLRLMMIEQFHNEELRKLYEKTMFTDPYKIQKGFLKKFVDAGMISESDADRIAREYFSYMTMLTYKYLLNGELTAKRKKAYTKEVHEYMSEAMARWANSANKSGGLS